MRACKLADTGYVLHISRVVCSAVQTCVLNESQVESDMQVKADFTGDLKCQDFRESINGTNFFDLNATGIDD